MSKTFFSIVIDQLHNDKGEWDETKAFTERLFLTKMPDTIAIHFKQLSVCDRLEVEAAMATLVHIWNKQRVSKQTKNN